MEKYEKKFYELITRNLIEPAMLRSFDSCISEETRKYIGEGKCSPEILAKRIKKAVSEGKTDTMNECFMDACKDESIVNDYINEQNRAHRSINSGRLHNSKW